MSYKLYLDDFRAATDSYVYTKDKQYLEPDWVLVKDYTEFVEHITEHGIPDKISFDHDLADEHYNPSMYSGTDVYNEHYSRFVEKTGLDCAKWLIEYCQDNQLDLPEFHCHSQNPAGKENIMGLLFGFQKFQISQKL